MRSWTYLLGAVVIAVAASVAKADMIGWQVPIASDQEVAPPTIPGDEPTGVGIVWLDTDANALSWTVHYAGLSDDLTLAHFHGPAPAGANAGVQVTIAASPEPKFGTLIGDAILSDDQESDLLDGLWYINLHTALNPGGEIRGQITAEDIIPEPMTLSILGLGAAALLRRRRSF